MTDDIPLIVALEHPSLNDAIDRFADELRSEQRFFGPRAVPAPFPSLINRVVSTGGLRMGAMVDGRLIGMARVEHDGTTSIAVAADWRCRGVGGSLLAAAVRRAGDIGLGRVVLRSSRRSRSVTALGASVGATTVDQGGGRIDLIFFTGVGERTA